jgi:hypothetical protein
MSKNVDICIVVDTVSLIATYPAGTYQNPQGTKHDFAYMIAQSDCVDKGQASGDLIVKNLVNNDTVRWRMISLSGDTDQAAVIYDITHTSGPKVMSSESAYESSPYVPLPILTDDNKNTQPPSFKNDAIETDYFLQANIVGHGTEHYAVKFYVTKPDAKGKPVLHGYYWWDPAVTVP